MTDVRTFPTDQVFTIPGLATVTIKRFGGHLLPEVIIELSPEYDGDLRDIARTTPGSDDVYLRCNSIGSIDNAELAKFLEVLEHWDHTGDDVPDCDEIARAIDDALSRTALQPKPFHRPKGGWYVNSLMRMMPPQPSRHVVFGFGKLQTRFRWYHRLMIVPMLALVISLVWLQEYLLPWTKYSVISAWLAGAHALGLATWLAFVTFVAASVIFRRRGSSSGQTWSPYTYGFFNKAAVYEEQAFREGSEHWTWSQRIRSCLAFGALHMVNLFYPLATILPLAVGGGMFMFFYLRKYRQLSEQPRSVLGTMHLRRAAVLESSIWHRVYNWGAILVFVAAILYSLGSEALGLIGLIAGMLGIQEVVRRSTNRSK